VIPALSALALAVPAAGVPIGGGAGAIAPSAAFAAVVGFALGACPWGLWLGRVFRGVDVRTMGSGNLGTTNVYRSLGPALGIATLLLDALKGALPVWLAPMLAPHGVAAAGEWCRLVAGFAAVAGHMFTPFARFKGGKGVATTVGVLLALAPLAFGVFVAVFVSVVAVTRYVSLGSILGSLAFVATLALWPRGAGMPTLALGAALALLIVARHRDNIGRLMRGEESRFSLRGGKERS
jgi:glycerol-3-phosphate acyltransferase PlsY